MEVDEFFVSLSLKILNCGYLDHGCNTGDHCPIWLEVEKDSLLGTNPSPVPRQQAQSLTTRDPHVVKKYNHLLEQESEKHDMYRRDMNN